MITMRKRLQEMTDLVQANLTKAQKKQKQHYGEKARPQTFDPGHKVLCSSRVREDLKQILNEFPDVAGEKLGRTSVIQYEIHVMDSEQIHQQPYRVPVACIVLGYGHHPTIYEPLGFSHSVG